MSAWPTKTAQWTNEEETGVNSVDFKNVYL
jgi:hypothetical protein